MAERPKYTAAPKRGHDHVWTLYRDGAEVATGIAGDIARVVYDLATLVDECGRADSLTKRVADIEQLAVSHERLLDRMFAAFEELEEDSVKNNAEWLKNEVERKRRLAAEKGATLETL